MSTVQEFSTLNGYTVKDATARQGVADLDTNKVNKADIADNLTTEDAAKVLSAKQGKALADLIDGHDDRISDVEAGTFYYLNDESTFADFRDVTSHSEDPNTYIFYESYGGGCRYIGTANVIEGYAAGFRFFSAYDREFVTVWFTSASDVNAKAADVEIEPVIKPVAVFYDSSTESLSIGE